MTDVGRIEFNTWQRGWPQPKTKELLLSENKNETITAEDNVMNKQVGGSHYKQQKIQPYEFFLKNQIPHHKAAVIRRILRYDHPTGKGLEDLQKIMHEIEMIIQLEDWGSVEESKIDTQVEEKACQFCYRKKNPHIYDCFYTVQSRNHPSYKP